MIGRPRRSVVDLGADGYSVTNARFTTTDRVLAEAVARALDRIDPLPCPHGGETVNIRNFEDPCPQVICSWCGGEVDPDAEPRALLGMDGDVDGIALSSAELTELKERFLDAWHNGRTTWLT